MIDDGRNGTTKTGKNYNFQRRGNVQILRNIKQVEIKEKKNN